MLRAIVALVVASTVLAVSASTGWTGVKAPNGKRPATEEAGQITLRLRYRLRPWKTSLYIKLVKTKLISFTACGIRNYHAGDTFGCDAAGIRLPEQTTMRIEQNPVGRALRRDDSPGWGMLGISPTHRIGAVLSNEVTGDRFGTFRYRVTMRDTSGKVLATSNIVKVIWHR